MSYDSSNLTTPDIKWLGVRPSDLDRLNIPQQCRLPMTDEDMRTGRKLVRPGTAPSQLAPSGVTARPVVERRRNPCYRLSTEFFEASDASQLQGETTLEHVTDLYAWQAQQPASATACCCRAA